MKFEGPMLESIVPKESSLEDGHTGGIGDIRFDVYKLIHATENEPVQDFLVKDLLKELDYECWTNEDGKRITPKEVLAIYKKADYKIAEVSKKHPALEKHLNRIMNADLSHPVIIYKESLVDGVHRLCKAVIEESETIKSKVLAEIPKEAVLKKSE